MKKQQLNIRFHNPNSAEVTAEWLLKIFAEAAKPKVEIAIRHAANEHRAEQDEQECSETATLTMQAM